MTEKKTKSAKRTFMAQFVTFWVNLIRRSIDGNLSGGTFRIQTMETEIAIKNWIDDEEGKKMTKVLFN